MKYPRSFPALLLALAFVLLTLTPARAADLFIAQAANFMPAMKEIIPAFEKATGLSAEATYTSTGKLYGQIKNGAPYDLFLAADRKRPALLFREKLAGEPFVYARGSVALWSLKKDLCAMPWPKALMAASKVALANVETAPYGAAAMYAMKEANIWADIQPRLVFGQNVTQVFQFAYTGAADMGFIAYSSTFTDKGRKGCYIMLPEAPEVIQAACKLNSAPHPEAAERFIEFLRSPEAKAIKKKYGYK